jgi:hypothetical protein
MCRFSRRTQRCVVLGVVQLLQAQQDAPLALLGRCELLRLAHERLGLVAVEAAELRVGVEGHAV